MYTLIEIETIIENCETSSELLYCCKLFKMLILFGDLNRSKYLEVLTSLRFRELENLNL